MEYEESDERRKTRGNVIAAFSPPVNIERLIPLNNTATHAR
jgi:hypothetical protein